MVAGASTLLPLAVLLLSPVFAFQYLTVDTLPVDGLTTPCIAALTAELDCSGAVETFPFVSYSPTAILVEECTEECAESLSEFRSNVAASCVGETYPDIYGVTAGAMDDIPIEYAAVVLEHHYNRTCLTDDTNRWCNNVALLAVGGDPAEGEVPGVSKRQVPDPEPDPVDPCDDCLVKIMQFQVGSFVEGSDDLESAYSSYTSSCTKTDFPITFSPPPFTVTPTSASSVSSAAPTPTCAGTTYNIVTGDTCESVSLSQGIGTAWLLFDNDLEAFCADFPASGSLCISSVCETYTVLEGDTCKSIAAAYDSSEVTEVLIGSWNPILGPICRAIALSVGHEICVSPPGSGPRVPVSSTITSALPDPTPTAAPVPPDVDPGTNTNCAEYHLVIPGEYCNILVMRYAIVLADFMFLNQGVNENCTNLYAYTSYCVRPVGPISEYEGHPDYVPPEVSVSVMPFSDLPTATYVQPTITMPPVLPLATGTRSGCWSYVEADTLIDDSDAYEEAGYASRCHLLAKGWGVALTDLKNWNPSLDIASPTCGPVTGFRYCMLAYDQSLSPPKNEEPGSELPVAVYPKGGGEPEDCAVWFRVRSGMTCAQVLEHIGRTLAEFYEWNPSVSADCSTMFADTLYCSFAGDMGPLDPEPSSTVSSAPPSSSTPPPTSTSSAPSPPGPTQAGQHPNCNAWHLVESGDGCWSISVEYSITLQDFYDWNTAVTDDCASGFWGGYAYCVGIEVPAPPGPPGPTQAGVASNCNAWHLAVSGDGCWDITVTHSITLTQFYTWNPAITDDCASGFWLGYAYCVGVS